MIGSARTVVSLAEILQRSICVSVDAETEATEEEGEKAEGADSRNVDSRSGWSWRKSD